MLARTQLIENSSTLAFETDRIVISLIDLLTVFSDDINRTALLLDCLFLRTYVFLA
jgi:hypothetical protein